MVAERDALRQELDSLQAQSSLVPSENPISEDPTLEPSDATIKSSTEPPPSDEPVDELQGAVTITLNGTKLDPKDISNNQYSDYYQFDFTYTNNTDKEIRGFESVAIFNDIFMKPILKVTLDNSQRIPANSSINEKDMYLELNQFMDDHNKLKATAYEDLIFTFEIKTVLFSDGTKIE